MAEKADQRTRPGDGGQPPGTCRVNSGRPGSGLPPPRSTIPLLVTRKTQTNPTEVILAPAWPVPQTVKVTRNKARLRNGHSQGES